MISDSDYNNLSNLDTPIGDEQVEDLQMSQKLSPKKVQPSHKNEKIMFQIQSKFKNTPVSQSPKKFELGKKISKPASN